MGSSAFLAPEPVVNRYAAGRDAVDHQVFIDTTQLDRNGAPYADLPPDLQHANLAAARRIPAVLAVAGLHIVSGEDAEAEANALPESEALALLETHIEAAAIVEHAGWMAEKLGSGWKYGPERNDAAKVHPSLIPYADLSEVEKEKDRSAVRNYPAIVWRAGMRVARP